MLCPERDKWALYADFTPKICPFYAKTLPILQSLATDENTQQGALLTRSMPAKFPVSFSKSSQSSSVSSLYHLYLVMESVLFFYQFCKDTIILHHMTCHLIMPSHEYAKIFPFPPRPKSSYYSYFPKLPEFCFWPQLFVGKCHPDPVVGGGQNLGSHWSHVSVRGQRQRQRQRQKDKDKNIKTKRLDPVVGAG